MKVASYRILKLISYEVVHEIAEMNALSVISII
jgi:hypothetical protein